MIYFGGSAQGAAIKQFSGDLSFRYQDFAQNVGRDPGNRYWSELNFTYDDKEPFVDHEGRFDFTMRYNDVGGYFWSVKEAQKTFMGNNYEWSLGLLIVDWSAVDQEWGLGKINNRVNIDYFDPGQSGLPGSRLKMRLAKSVELDTYLSFLYIPELNPGYKINESEGTIDSKNPWAPPPASTTDATGSEKQIFYSINKPAVEDVIFQLSYGTNLKLSFSEQLHLSAFYLRKPENNLSNNAIVEVSNSTFIPYVYVTPKLYYHQLWGGQLTYETQKKDVQLYTGYIISQPGSKPSNDTSVRYGGYAFKLEKQDEEYWGTGIRYNFLGGLLKLGHLVRLSSFDNDLEFKKPRWGEAVHAGVDYMWSNTLSSSLEVFYDILNKDRLLKCNTRYVYNQSLAVTVGANLLTSPDDGDGYWAEFRTNDSIYTQVGIVF
jgi:hypothetical protein